MEIQQDYKELLQLFNKYKVEYIIIGSYALAHYGAPGYTGLIDLYVNPVSENAEKIISALGDFGFGSWCLSTEDLCTPQKVVQLGSPPVRIDLITSIAGVEWSDALKNKVPAFYGDVPVFFIGREEYIAFKRASSIKKDIADTESISDDSE